MKYCNRPFQTVEEMNEAIIQNWNKVVPKNGIVFNLGDICFDVKSIHSVIPRLNGTIYHIKGNHDNTDTIKYLRSQGIETHDIAEISVIDSEIGIQDIVLFHYPILEWNKKFHGSWHLYGHIHSLEHKGNNASLDVGIDGHNITPWSYQEVKEQITKQLLYGRQRKV